MTSEKGKSKTRDKGGDKDKSKKKTHHSSHKPKEEKLDPLFRTYGSAGRHFRPDELEVHKKVIWIFIRLSFVLLKKRVVC